MRLRTNAELQAAIKAMEVPPRQVAAPAPEPVPAPAPTPAQSKRKPRRSAAP